MTIDDILDQLKPLEWCEYVMEIYDGRRIVALTAFGRYEIVEWSSGEIHSIFDSRTVKPWCASVEDGKLACELDYHTRASDLFSVPVQSADELRAVSNV